MMRWVLALAAVALLQTAAPVYIPYEEAAGLLAGQRDLRPEGGDLPAKAGSRLQISASDWPGWVAKRDAEIRARLAQGDEDSLVYLWLYGTSFTKLPRATAEQIAALKDPAKAEALLIDRLEAFVAALASPRAARDERLQFARRYLGSKRIDVATEAGRLKELEFFVKARERVVAENAEFRRATDAVRHSATAESAQSAYATLFRDRGLSTDTRLTASYAIDRAVAAVASEKLLAFDSVRRAAIVGPGLDFIDKAEGYDFYPPQTIQPFALIDSLNRYQLRRTGMQLVAYDVSARVLSHLSNAVKRAAIPDGYRLQLPRPSDRVQTWTPEFAAYWKSFGELIGMDIVPAPRPAGMAGVRVRAVGVSPNMVSTIVPRDLNIIVQRETLAPSERFDLIVATNVLVYYDAFEQSLALANIASMLRPGGIFLTNYAVAPSAQMDALPQLTTRVFFDDKGNGDSVYVYRRR
jgi:SAM-dependent methyltransferase